MRAQRHKTLEDILLPYELSQDGGRRLDAGGFLLADPFDMILRRLNHDYLRKAWERATAILTKHKVAASDLTWGALHPGETYLPTEGTDTTKYAVRNRPSPIDFIGWTSRHLAWFDKDERFMTINQQLLSEPPLIRMGFTWRSLKWNIPPAEVSLGLDLIEYMGIDEISEWSPELILREADVKSEPWIMIAKALHENDQEALDQAIIQARESYTATGFRMVLLGYSGYMQHGIGHFDVQLSDF